MTKQATITNLSIRLYFTCMVFWLIDFFSSLYYINTGIMEEGNPIIAWCFAHGLFGCIGAIALCSLVIGLGIFSAPLLFKHSELSMDLKQGLVAGILIGCEFAIIIMNFMLWRSLSGLF